MTLARDLDLEHGVLVKQIPDSFKRVDGVNQYEEMKWEKGNGNGKLAENASGGMRTRRVVPS